MPENSAIDKTISNPAKLLRGYMLATGITDAKQIADDLGIPLRTIQRLKLECAISGADDRIESAIYGVSGRIKSANSAIYGVSDAEALACVGNTTRATNESLRDSSYLEVIIPLAPKAVDEPSPEPSLDAPIKTPTPAKLASPKATAKRGSRLDVSWELPTEWRTWARVNFPASTDASVTDQAEQFRDYWISKPGAQACKLDWEATWRNWCRKGLSAYGSVRQPQHTGRYASHPPGQKSVREMLAEIGDLQ